MQKQPSVIHRYGTRTIDSGNMHKNQESLVRIVNLEGRQMFVEKAQKSSIRYFIF